MTANGVSWRHTGAMPTIRIRNVPEETHAVLRRRAANADQSLQDYLRAKLIADANEPTLEEVLARVDRRRCGRASLAETTAMLRDDRHRC